MTFLESATEWWSLFAMGVFFTIGSLIFIRPFLDSPRPPLCPRLFKTDEILAASMFFVASLPAPFYAASFVAAEIKSAMNWSMLLCAILFVIISGVFLYYAYKDSTTLETNYIRDFIIRWIGNRPFVEKHFHNDLIVALWICFWGCIISSIGAILYLLFQLIFKGGSKEIYLIVIGSFDMLLFGLGFAYFLSSSYMHQQGDKNVII